MSQEAFNLLKDIVGWLAAPLLGLVVWAWKRNEEEHKMLFEANQRTRQDTSDSHSRLMDKFMEHVDDKNRETLGYVRAEDKKLMEELSVQRSHIAKLFDKLEDHGHRSENRHLEMLTELRNMSNQMHQALATKADK